MNQGKMPVIAYCLPMGGIVIWLILLLAGSDAYYMPYVVCAVLAALGLFRTFGKEVYPGTKQAPMTETVFAALFSVLTALANYGIWMNSPILEERCYPVSGYAKLLVAADGIGGSIGRGATAAGLLFGGFFVGKYLLRFAGSFLGKDESGNSFGKVDYVSNKLAVLSGIVSFVLLLAVWFLFYFGAKFPGNISPDTISQFTQNITHAYSNHHPYYHTILERICMAVGSQVTGISLSEASQIPGAMNTLAAFYVVFQQIFLAACFGFAVATVYRATASKTAAMIAFLFFLLMPYHLIYSFTLWKDIIFGGFVLLVMIFLFRYLYEIGPAWVSLGGIFVSGGGVCLFRSNGYFAFAFLFGAVVITVIADLRRGIKKDIPLVCVCLAVLILSFVMKHPVLERRGVTQPDTVEALSIPLQQIARVFAEEGSVTAEEKEFLDRIFDTDMVSDYYRVYISDSVKELARSTGDIDFLRSNMVWFLKVYAKIGVRNFGAYVHGYVDETKGYWNGGYRYWYIWDYVSGNELGLEREVKSEALAAFLDGYAELFESEKLPLHLFLSIGFCDLLFVMMAFLGILAKNKKTLLAAVLPLALIVSLLISTPVYSEFRYVYALYCVLPVGFLFVYCKDRNTKDETEQ